MEKQRRAAEAEAIAELRAHAQELKRAKTPPEMPEEMPSIFAGEREKTPEPAKLVEKKTSAGKFFDWFYRKKDAE